jgi:hypothetical protein
MRSLFALAALPLVFAAPTAQKATRSGVRGPKPDSYMVVLKKTEIASTSEALASIAGGIVSSVDKAHVYDHGNFKGFAGSLSGAQVNAIKNDPRVAYVEKDGWATTQQQENFVTQSGVPWGLSRISSRKLGGSTYTYDKSAGAGVCAYIVDTGFNSSLAV